MKHITLFLLIMASMMTGCKKSATDSAASGAESTAADTSKPTEAPVMDSAAMMKAWENWMTPGDMHALMASWAGTWEADTKTYMDPGAPPEESKATSVVKMALNGLYQLNTYTGTMMGMPFEGHGVMGFDNAKKQFVSTWIDNMGSGILYLTGQWDPATKTLHLKGTQTDPMTGKDTPFREEYKVIDENNHSLTLFGAGMDGKETKMMEFALKRKT